MDIRAKVTIFTDGVRGNLTKSLVRQLGLDEGRSPQVYAIGIKELWEVPAGRTQPGRVIHTMGYPLKTEEFGGAFIYTLPDNVVSLGLVTGLDYRDPMFDPHVAFQHVKRHPLFASILEGGQLIRYGAKALPEGGWYTIPKTYAAGRADCGGRGGLHELGAAQGHSPGDAHRDVRRRDRVRRRPQGGRVRGGAEGVRRSHPGERRACG